MVEMAFQHYLALWSDERVVKRLPWLGVLLPIYPSAQCYYFCQTCLEFWILQPEVYGPFLVGALRSSVAGALLFGGGATGVR